jgi:hypothetical protein
MHWKSLAQDRSVLSRCSLIVTSPRCHRPLLWITFAPRNQRVAFAVSICQFSDLRTMDIGSDFSLQWSLLQPVDCIVGASYKWPSIRVVQRKQQFGISHSTPDSAKFARSGRSAAEYCDVLLCNILRGFGENTETPVPSNPLLINYLAPKTRCLEDRFCTKCIRHRLCTNG